MNKNLVLVMLATAFLACISISATAQNLCSKQTGDAMKIHIRNATNKAITVNYVDENCKESKSDSQIEPGKAFSGDATSGDAFRVRDVGGAILKEIVVNDSNSEITIGVVKNSDPRQSFIQTLNQIRRGRNLPEIELNEQLNNSCQWFADLMAKFGKGGHDAVLIGGNSYADMQNPWDRSKKMGYLGDGGTEATGETSWTDINTLGGEAMIGWASSSTHFRPFLGMDGQMFKHVGFGYAKSAKNGNYYTCAVFGNPDDNGNNKVNNEKADKNQANIKEPIKTQVPDGLKFNEANFLDEVNGKDKYGTMFSKSQIDELNAMFSFENPSGQAFNIEVRSYHNDKMIDSQSLKDLQGSGSMSIHVAGELGKKGSVTAGSYRFEVLLNGEIVLSAEATVK